MVDATTGALTHVGVALVFGLVIMVMVAAAGHPVTVVEGEPTNLKLTTAEDLEVLEAVIREHEAAGAVTTS